MVKEIELEEYLQSNGGYVLLDTRTPAEYEKAHMLGANNLPLLDNEERAIIGTTFKQVGREEAILQGFDLTGHKWRSFIEQALEFAPNKKVAVYCWRGGMRSGIMSWILDLYGFDVVKIKKGYKGFRNWVLDQFEKDYNIIVLGGMTGSHKTEVLMEFKTMGEQIIDLEGLAKHCGSSYGTMNIKFNLRKRSLKIKWLMSYMHLMQTNVFGLRMKVEQLANWWCHKTSLGRCERIG